MLKKLIFTIFKTKNKKENTELDIQMETLFKSRYHHFKLLLAANNRAMELMTDIEQALRGNKPFGMSFVRAHCTALSATVFKIIRNLQALAPDKYAALKSPFNQIQNNISSLIEHKHPPKAQSLVMLMSEINKNSSDQIGNKLGNLGEIKNILDIKVPEGFVLTTLAYDVFMQHNGLKDEINRLIQSTPLQERQAIVEDEYDAKTMFDLSAKIQSMIIKSEIPSNLKQIIFDNYQNIFSKLEKNKKISMRSSALGEDSLGASFAGQYHSELNVDKEDILQVYKEIVASKYSIQAISYRLKKGIKDEDVPMCVGCLEMLSAKSAGVVYTQNPLDINDQKIFINSVWGLGKAVVDGSINTDLFVLEKNKSPILVYSEIQQQEKKLICEPLKGIVWSNTTDQEKKNPSLSSKQASELAILAQKIENHYGHPQDIEWLLDKSDNLIILQTRPLSRQLSTIPQKNEKIPIPPLLQGGITASSGVGTGKVFIVQKDVDLLLFPENSILVSSKSIPKWASVLPKARGLIAEHGSIAGHLANVAREFKVPALFGLKDASKNMYNGQEITLDADNKTIYPGKIEQLLQSNQYASIMYGSPIHNTLQEIAKYIIPLNMLDPDSLDFKPEYCSTLHDLTRFCHEKAVQEMFNFGKNNSFSPRSSKQLKAGVLMQWWLINLDDGFTEEVQGPHVRLSQIASIPMLAIWKGATAMQWEGPPSLDGKGFMSVLFQATANPHLNTASASDFANRNYFMISKNFCNLQSRFGFHFTTIEALVGDRVRENYIRFQFKGGAADYPRRVRRAKFIGEILDGFDFMTKVREDALFARMDNYPREELEKKLIVLGHLIIHTRQLDMIMSREESVQYYKHKIIADIEQVLSR